MRRSIVLPATLFVAVLLSPALEAQQLTPYSPEQVSAEDYARAERRLAQFTRPLVLGGSVRASWLEDGSRFWYRTTAPEGVRYILVDPEAGTREAAFDHDRMTSALNALGEPPYSASDLPLAGLEFAGDLGSVSFQLGGERVTCDLSAYRCEVEAEPEPEPGAGRNVSVSPDGRRAAFIRDHNLWLRDLETGTETQLTTDGVEDYGYATNNAGWVRRDSPVLRWSPGADKIATFQHDARGVGMMYLVNTQVGHPELEAWRYPLPEDSVIFRVERVVIHLDEPSDAGAPAGAVSPRVVRFDMDPDPHRSSICDHIACGGEFSDTEWSPDARHMAFLSNSRDHKVATLRIADVETGEVRTILEETAETFFESGVDAINWRILWDRGEVLWWSQRSDWGHFYRYDLETGAFIAPVTSGNWATLQLLHRDGGDLYFTGGGREPGDPYLERFYRVSLEGGDVQLLTPDSAHHTIQLAPSGEYFVDQFSAPDIPPRSVVRDMDGRVVVDLEEADVSGLVASGWVPPEPFVVKARDGQTDLYGLMYRPAGFDPTKRYPVVNYLYPGPQTGSIGSRSFSPARRDHQALTELGFVVVEVDAMGTPGRSKSFHDAYYGNMGDNGLPDQVATIRQLGERHPWMDLDRVGIWGHSGGGFASTAGILRYPDFYKVAVSQAGNHDNRNYEDDWGEKWQGLLEEYEDGTTNYDNQANQLLVGNLKGKLLLAHGTLDNNVPPSNTMVVVDALIEANKDFDLILMTNRRHGFAFEPYMLRRRWDYFVRNLLGSNPPVEFEFGQQRRPVS